MKTALRLLFAFAFAFAIAFIAATPPHAADATTPVVTAATPWYTSGIFWTSLISVVTTLIAIWTRSDKNATADQLTTASKINDTLVTAIEAATKIPEVAAFEKTIKSKITDVATKAGVEPLLNELVKDLT